MFFNENLPNGSVVPAFAQRVSVNPVTESTAVVIAIPVNLKATLIREDEEEKILLGVAKDFEEDRLLNKNQVK